MIMKALTKVLACCALLTACGSSDTVDKPPSLMLADLVKQQVALRKASKAKPVNAAAVLTRAQLAGINTPLIRVRVEQSGDFSLLYVAQNSKGAQIWKSPDNVSFTLRDGIVTQTRGLGDDLFSADVAGLQGALKGRGTRGGVARINLRMDGTNSLVTTRFTCDITDLGPKTVTVLERGIPARHYQEACKGGTDAFTNDYWVDSRGVVRASRQWIGPVFGHVYLERLID